MNLSGGLALVAAPVLLTAQIILGSAALFAHSDDETCTPATTEPTAMATVPTPAPATTATTTSVSRTAVPVVAAAQPPAAAGASPAPQVVAGFRGQQLVNAAAVIRAGRALGLDGWSITVGLMTAIGESDLVNADHGDAAGPDSRGIFQQRGNGAWGSYADRMSPQTAATAFFRALTGVPGYRGMSPTAAAHAVQRNADPDYYARFWADAVTLYAALSGSAVTDPATATTASPCADTGAEGAGAVSGAVDAACPGRSVTGYGNGRLPLDALCPLWGAAKDQRLRADAAAAFNTMTKVYAAQFGTPICVTDSYRDYDSQVAVKAAKPGLAARPGKSNHGWGRAVDLCGGIQRFGTTTHQWMQRNAGRFGWCHPAWAEPDGSKPEPWHWEYGCTRQT